MTTARALCSVPILGMAVLVLSEHVTFAQGMPRYLDDHPRGGDFVAAFMFGVEMPRQSPSLLAGGAAIIRHAIWFSNCSKENLCVGVEGMFSYSGGYLGVAPRHEGNRYIIGGIASHHLVTNGFFWIGSFGVVGQHEKVIQDGNFETTVLPDDPYQPGPYPSTVDKHWVDADIGRVGLALSWPNYSNNMMITAWGAIAPWNKDFSGSAVVQFRISRLFISSGYSWGPTDYAGGRYFLSIGFRFFPWLAWWG